ncbi:DNA invertase Pin-like site-specific DNA recombinase [Arthrobacter oryzae]|nr:DNA invertase Pin-like site-specific DNA recombinase [Arthrobacter oryzae]
MGAFAEFERSLIRERQRKASPSRNSAGAYKGRKKTLTPERAAELVQRAGGGVPKALPCFPAIMVFLFSRGLYLQMT